MPDLDFVYEGLCQDCSDAAFDRPRWRAVLDWILGREPNFDGEVTILVTADHSEEGVYYPASAVCQAGHDQPLDEDLEDLVDALGRRRDARRYGRAA